MDNEEKILKTVEEIKTQTSEMHLFIAGNPKYGQKGLKDIIDEHTVQINGLTTRLDKKDKQDFKRSVMVGTVVSGSGFLGGILTKSWIVKALTAIGLIKGL